MLQPAAPSVQAFAQDLYRIRMARGLSLEQLQERTKIMAPLLEQFEATALVDHPHFNLVYQRAYVRTYAEALRLDPAIALRAFEEALADAYQGRLAAAYLPGDEAPVRMPRRDRQAERSERRNGVAEAA